MTLEVTDDAAAIIALVEPLLAADPVRNTVFSSVAAGLRNDDADGWCAHPAGDPSVLAVRSQLYTPVVVTAGWDDLAALADAVAALPVASVGGPVPVVEALVTALGRHGLVATSRMAERLFRLDELTEPAGVGGTARIATLEDRGLLASWYEPFELEVFGAVRPGADAEAFVERVMQRSRFWLWTDADGTACAMAARHPVAFGVARIGPVYTPRELRGRGYGSAVTAAATRDVLNEAAVPVLYTDVANPTSNKIYQRLGYYPVEDRAHVAFS
jgi:RimJ/RimL family protein N-acetyltransferase